MLAATHNKVGHVRKDLPILSGENSDEPIKQEVVSVRFAWSIFVAVAMTIMGLLAFLRYEKISRGQIKNHEKYVLGHSASKAEIAISRISIRFGGIVFATLGIALLINTLLNMEYGV
jgi:hypothetical protein